MVFASPPPDPKIAEAQRRVLVAEKIQAAKVLEHEAALIAGTNVDEARNALIAATEAMVDAKEALYYLVFKSLDG